MRGYPAAAHWIDAEPIEGISVMAGIEDRRRHFVVAGEPVVTGLVAGGEAWACNNRRSAAASRSARCTPACSATWSPRRVWTTRSSLVRRFHGETEAVVRRMSSPRGPSTATGYPRATRTSPDVTVPDAEAGGHHALAAGPRRHLVLTRTTTAVGRCR